jgi:hypothetical protein
MAAHMHAQLPGPLQDNRQLQDSGHCRNLMEGVRVDVA